MLKFKQLSSSVELGKIRSSNQYQRAAVSGFVSRDAIKAEIHRNILNNPGTVEGRLAERWRRKFVVEGFVGPENIRGNFHRPVFKRRTIKAREEGKIIRRFPEIRHNSWYSALILCERRTLASFVLFYAFPEHLQSSIRLRSENEFSLRSRARILTLLHY